MIQYEADYFTTAFLQGHLHLKKEWPELNVSFEYLAKPHPGPTSPFSCTGIFSRETSCCYGEGPASLTGRADDSVRWGMMWHLSLLIPTPIFPFMHGRKYWTNTCALLEERRPDLTDSFMERYYPLAIFRNLQILGAFSYLSEVMGKTYFEAYIPAALKSLGELLGKVTDARISPLRDLVERISNLTGAYIKVDRRAVRCYINGK